MLNSTRRDLAQLTAADFRALARAALYGEPQPEIPALESHPVGPVDLAHEAIVADEAQAPERPAAVLVPVMAKDELSLLFTRRTDHLPSHAGQIAFPGGKTEERDASPLATALREAEEEIGLNRALVEPLGFLDSHQTGTGYRITPVVALVSPDFTPVINRDEVVDTFEVPLSFLMDPGNHQIHVRTVAGKERRFHAMPYGEHFIWGATAAILRNMRQRLLRS